MRILYLPIIMTMQPGWFQRGMKREISRKLILIPVNPTDRTAERQRFVQLDL